MNNTAWSAVAIGVLAGIAGCASSDERPDRALAIAETNIQQAEQAGANQYAAQPLSSAKDKLSAAETAVAREEMVSAQRLAEEAAVDAQLAAAMTRNRKAEEAIQELEDTIDVLRDEIERGQSPMGEMQ